MKYIDIKIVGHEYIRAFENKEKTKDKHPDYKADGVGIWMKESKEKY